MDNRMMAVGPEDLIVVKQLPVIEDRLEEAYLAVQDRLKGVSTLVVTEENYKELKKTRADLNREFSELESVRKRVKAAIEAPYKAFESGVYKRLADEYKSAVDALDGEIKAVEASLKDARQAELLEFYDEYRRSLGLDAGIADPRKSGIKVGLTGSMKALKEQARAYLDKVDGDLKMIDTFENADEVLAEYRICLSVTDAVRAVAGRNKRIAEERARREAEAEVKAQREETVAQVDEVINEALGAPKQEAVEEEPVQEEVLSTKYLGIEIFGTLEQLKALKAFLKNALIEYLEEEGMMFNG